LREAYGPGVAFLYGWKCLLVMDPGLTAALATGLGAYAAVALPGLSAKTVALVAIAAVAAANVLGVRVAGAIGHGLALAKIGLLLAIVAWGFASGAGDAAHFIPFVARRPGAPPLVPALAGALVLAFFSFGGWWEAAKLAGEVRDPQRALPRALAIGVGTVTLLYASVSAVFLYLVPIGPDGSPETFAAQAGVALFGPSGGRAPVQAIALQAALAAILVSLGTFEAIAAYFIFVTVAFLALTVAGLYRLPAPEAAHRIPGWPLTPLAFLVMLFATMALLAAGHPLQAVLGTAVVGTGIPVYRLLLAPGRRVPIEPDPMEKD